MPRAKKARHCRELPLKNTEKVLFYHLLSCANASKKSGLQVRLYQEGAFTGDVTLATMQDWRIRIQVVHNVLTGKEPSMALYTYFVPHSQAVCQGNHLGAGEERV